MYVSYLELLQNKLNSGFFRLKKQLSVDDGKGVITENTIVIIELFHNDIDCNDNICYELKLNVVEEADYPKLYCLSNSIYVKFTSHSSYSKDYSENFQWFDKWFEPVKEFNDIKQKYDDIQRTANDWMFWVVGIGVMLFIASIIWCKKFTDSERFSDCTFLVFAAIIFAGTIFYYLIEYIKRFNYKKLIKEIQTISERNE